MLPTLVLCTVALPGQQTGPADQKLSPQEIVDAIEEEIRFDPAVPYNSVDVAVSDGTVVLTGTTDNLMARRQASRIARTVRGVRTVTNQIEVEPSELRMDWQVEEDVEFALLQDPATESYEVEVEVDDGEVVLSGAVDSWQERWLTEKVAASVRGVTNMDNRLEVTYDATRPDVELGAEIREALRWDTLVDHALVDVQVQGGDVKLTGVVGSAAEKKRAENTSYVLGVDSVDATGLKVARWARDDDLRTAKYVDVDAKGVEGAIEAAWILDPRVDSASVSAEFSNGVVTLRGTVPNRAASEAATSCARNTVGVRRVDNRIRVRTASLDAKAMTASIEAALKRDPYLENEDLIVEVRGNTAWLYGTVATHFEKTRAELAAQRTHGIADVRNVIAVLDPSPYVYDPYVDGAYIYDAEWYEWSPTLSFENDAEIRQDIRDELYWSPFVDSDDVTVTVSHGEATLTGLVGSWSEFRSATENAYEGGAIWVDNRLRVTDSGEN